MLSDLMKKCVIVLKSNISERFTASENVHDLNFVGYRESKDLRIKAASSRAFRFLELVLTFGSQIDYWNFPQLYDYHHHHQFGNMWKIQSIFNVYFDFPHTVYRLHPGEGKSERNNMEAQIRTL